MAKRLPITKAQRRTIRYRAAMEEQGRMIRALRDVLDARGHSMRYIGEFVSDVLFQRERGKVK